MDALPQDLHAPMCPLDYLISRSFLTRANVPLNVGAAFLSLEADHL